MATKGQTARGRDIGKKSSDSLYVWHACIDCGKERWVIVDRGEPRSKRCRSCGNRRTMLGLTGERSRNWKGGRYVKNSNYVHIRLQPNDFFYPMVCKNGYVLEHRLVVAQALGRCLLPWEIVHHKEGVPKDDNRYPETLELLPTRKYHLIDQITKAYIKKLETELHKFRELLADGKLAYVDREADLISSISFNLGILHIEIGSLYENYPTNFNLTMERLRKVLSEQGWVREVKE